jgi:ABC-type transport system involved in cytochrome bd biosynthesis fused ATPase/permease subunit
VTEILRHNVEAPPLETANLATGRVTTTWGTLLTLTGLFFAFVTSYALERIASSHVGEGLGLLAAVVLSRWLAAQLLDGWLLRTARRGRTWWRETTMEFFLGPSAKSNATPVQVASAIDTIVDGPRLAVIAASARASILALVVVFVAGGWQALGIVLVLLAIAVPLYQRAGRRAADFDARYRERRARLSERQLELLAHAPELRALGAVNYGAREIGALSVAEHHVALRAIRSALGSSLVTEFLSGVSVGLVAMDVGFGLLNGHISLLRALVCVLVTSEFFTHVRRYGVEFHRREAIDAATRLLNVPVAQESVGTALFEARELVTSAHPQAIDVTLRAGDRLAVLGPSGIGKTTLMHTLLGWREPLGGRVERSADRVGYVSADTTLVEGTLAENLRLGKDVSDVTLRRTLDALGLVDERFAHLEQSVSADGEGFSSGERVRLLIARALVHDPRALILDDVGGLLDEGSRQAVRRELEGRLDLAVVEVNVDDTLFISATTELRLT